MQKQAKITEICSRSDEKTTAYTQALRLEEQSEKLVLLTRTLQAYTGAVRAQEDVENVVKHTVPVRIGFTEGGWFRLTIPGILPKKEKGSPNYIRGYLFPAMKAYFCEKEPVRYRDSVLIYCFVYDRERPERKMRDHDNIEINAVTDIVALYVLPDDSPRFTSLYMTSIAGEEDVTEVFVVPRKDFAKWIAVYEENDGDGS